MRLLLLILFPVSAWCQKFEVQYCLQGNLTYEEVQNLEESTWENYTREVFQKSDTGSTWFKVLHKEPAERMYVIEIPSIFILSSNFFGDVNVISRDKIPFQRYEVISNSEIPIYIRVTQCKKGHIPITVSTTEQLASAEQSYSIFYTIYYSLACTIFFFTIIAYYQYRDKTYLIYLVMMVAVNLNRNAAEGDILRIVNNHFFTIGFEQTIHILVVIIGYWFSVNYLNMEDFRREKLRRIVTYSVLCSTALLIVYFVTHNSWFTFSSDVANLVGVTSILYFISLYFFTSTYAKLYCIAFSPLLFIAVDVYFLEPLGVKLIELNHLEYRFGMMFEMIILTLAIAYKGRTMIRENQQMQRSIRKVSNEFKISVSKGKTKKPWLVVAKSQYNLTKQEIKVLQHILDEKTNKEIAEKLFVSMNTVKFHTRNIYKKLEINSKKQVIEKIQEIPQKE